MFDPESDRIGKKEKKRKNGKGKDQDQYYKDRIEEFENAWEEFFDDKPAPDSEEEELRQQEEFIQWYNTERKQSDTGLTPEETGIGMFAFEREESAAARLVTAEACLERGEFDEAKELTQEILERYPINKHALFISAQSSLLKGDHEETMKVIEEWEEIDPDDPYPFILRAQLDIIEGDFQSALDMVDKTLEIDPQLFDAVITKAQILSLMDDERSEEFIEKAKDIDEERTEGFLDGYWIEEDIMGFIDENQLISKLHRAMSLINSDKTEEARELISEMKNVDPSQEVERTLNRMELESFMMDGKKDDVDRKVTERLKDDPEDPLALYYSAKLAYSNDEMEKALSEIDKCISVTEEKEYEHEVIDPFEYYDLKAEVLKSMGDKSWEDWRRKARKKEEHALNMLKTESENIGLLLEMKDEIPNIVEDSLDSKQNDGNKDNSKQANEKKEKTLDEFL